jgi:hypothetical protein
MPPQPQSHGYCGTVCDVIPLGNVGDDAQSNRRAKFKVLRAPGATASRPPSRGSRVLSGRTLHILACINFSMKCLKITKRTPKCSHGAPPGVGSGVGLFQRTVHSGALPFSDHPARAVLGIQDGHPNFTTLTHLHLGGEVRSGTDCLEESQSWPPGPEHIRRLGGWEPPTG